MDSNFIPYIAHHGPTKANDVTDEHTSDTTLRLLCWNIDGLGKMFTVERALAVCDLIESRKPDVVYLQEIVTATWAAIKEWLEPSYLLYRDEALKFSYTTCTEELRCCTAQKPNTEWNWEEKTVFTQMDELQTRSKFCIFGGDTNLMEKEVK